MGKPRQHERPRIVADICHRVARGELVVDACGHHGIERSTLYRWCEDNATYRNAYARARVDQAHAFAEQALAISDGRDGDAKSGLEAMLESIQGADEKDKDRLLNAMQAVAVQRDRLRVDTRKWMASKLAAKLYGDKQEVQHTGDVTVKVQFGKE